MEKCDGVYVYFTYEDYNKYLEWLMNESHQEHTKTDDIYPIIEITNGVNIYMGSQTD